MSTQKTIAWRKRTEAIIREFREEKRAELCMTTPDNTQGVAELVARHEKFKDNPLALEVEELRKSVDLLTEKVKEVKTEGTPWFFLSKFSDRVTAFVHEPSKPTFTVRCTLATLPAHTIAYTPGWRDSIVAPEI